MSQGDNQENKKRKDYGDFVVYFCMRLMEILRSKNTVNSLAEIDIEIRDNIYYKYKDVDSFTLTVKDKTYMEVLLYNDCNKFVEERFRNQQAFDIGSGIECIDNYFKLLSASYHAEYYQNIPNTFTNIKNLVIVRLKMIELSSNSDQAMLLYRDEIEGLFLTYKGNLEKEFSQKLDGTLNDLNEEISNVQQQKTDIYKDIITIISIFSGIILTFSGAFSFSSTMLQSINVANFYKLIVASSLICIFLLSLFFCLCFFLYNIRYNYPFVGNNSSENNQEDIERTKKSIRKHRLILFIPMIVIFATLVSIIVAVLIFHPSELSKSESEEGNVSFSMAFQNEFKTEGNFVTPEPQEELESKEDSNQETVNSDLISNAD